jgi:hypothetical protein
MTMYKIILIPQVGVNIEGVGQVNFGDSKEQLLNTWGQNDDAKDDHRIRFFKYGFFADFKNDENTFEAVEFWNDYDKNVSKVFIYETEVLQGDAQAIKKILQEKNNDEAPNDGWFVNIDVIYSGGNHKNVEAIIEQTKTEGLFDGEYKNSLMQDLENAKHFSSFGIGYKGYCKDGLILINSMGDSTK